MSAKRGCISTLRAAGFSVNTVSAWSCAETRRDNTGWETELDTKHRKRIILTCEGRHLHRGCATVLCLSVPSHTEAALYASLTHRRDLLCLHISHHPSLPPPILLSFSPMPAPLQKLGTPWEQLQQGFHCSSSRDTPPALQLYEQAVTIVCACLHVCSCVCHFSTQAQDGLFIKPMNTESRNHAF